MLCPVELRAHAKTILEIIDFSKRRSVSFGRKLHDFYWTFTVRLCSVQGAELRSRFLQHRAIRYRVSSKHRLGLVPRQLHGGGTRDTRTLEVSDGRAPEIVNQSAWDPGGFAG